jgi:hypothetical protein
VTDIGAHLYIGTPFLELPLDRFHQIEDAKPVFAFDAATEMAFLQAAPAWAFPVPFILAKTGLRIDELMPVPCPLNRAWGLTDRVTPGRARAAALPLPATPRSPGQATGPAWGW